jgi:hypothetical protein
MKRMVLLVTVGFCLGFISCGGQEVAPEETASTPASAGAEVPEHLLALLPAANDVAGWNLSQSPRTFTAENLWEFIDGAADGYLAYGFKEVVSADYEQEGTGYQAVVDIYEMQDPLNAFGIYAQERNPDYRFLAIGNEGYSGGTALNFWTGPYYVKITSFEENEIVSAEMTRIATLIAGRVTAPGEEPAEISYFPKAGLLPHTMQYIPKDVLAQSYLANGFEARYKTGDQEYKLLLLVQESPEAAQDALARYRQFLATSGKGIRDLKSPGEGGFSGEDSFYGSMAAIRSGRYIAVALGTPTQDAGAKVIGELLSNIK